MDNTKSIWHLYTNQIPTQFGFDNAELVLKLIDPNPTPLKDQHLSAVAKFTATKVPPTGSNPRIPDTLALTDELEEPFPISSDQSRGGGGVSWINLRKNRERTSPSTTFAIQFSDNPRGEKGEDVDEDDKADWANSTTTNEKQGRHEANPEEGDDAKSNPKHGGGNDAESNPREADDAKSAPLPQPDFDDAKFISRSMDLENTLMEGQHPRSLAEVAKVKNLPYREGIGPLMHVPMGINPKTPLTIAITAEIFTKILEDLGSMHSNVTRHVFQDLGGTRGINSVEGDVGDDLQDLLDPGGAPQDTKVGVHAQCGYQTRSWNTQEGGQCAIDNKGGRKEGVFELNF